MICIEARLSRLRGQTVDVRGPLRLISVLRDSLLAFEDMYFGTALVWEQACRERRIVRCISSAVSIMRSALSAPNQSPLAPRRQVHETDGFDSFLSLVFRVAEHAPNLATSTESDAAAEVERMITDAARLILVVLDTCSKSDPFVLKAIMILASMFRRPDFGIPMELLISVERQGGKDLEPCATTLLQSLRAALLSGQPEIIMASLGIFQSFCAQGQGDIVHEALASEIISALFDLFRISPSGDHPRVIACAFSLLRSLCSHPTLVEEFRYGLGPIVSLICSINLRDVELWAEATALLEALLCQDMLLPYVRGSLHSDILGALTNAMHKTASLVGEEFGYIHLMVANSIERLLHIDVGPEGVQNTLCVVRSLAKAVYDFHLPRLDLGIDCFIKLNDIMLSICAHSFPDDIGEVAREYVASIVEKIVVPATNVCLQSIHSSSSSCSVAASMKLISTAMHFCRTEWSPALIKTLLDQRWLSLTVGWIGRLDPERTSDDCTVAWGLIFQLVTRSEEAATGMEFFEEHPQVLLTLRDIHNVMDLLSGSGTVDFCFDEQVAFAARVAMLDLLFVAYKHGDDLESVLDRETMGSAVRSFVDSHSGRLIEMSEVVPVVIFLISWSSRQLTRSSLGSLSRCRNDDILLEFLRKCSSRSFIRMRPGTVQSSIVLSQPEVPEVVANLVSAWSCRCWRWPRSLESMRLSLIDSVDERAPTEAQNPSLRFGDIVVSLGGASANHCDALACFTMFVLHEATTKGITASTTRALQVLYAAVKYVVVPGGTAIDSVLFQKLCEVVDRLLSLCNGDRMWETETFYENEGITTSAHKYRVMHVACLLFEMSGILLDRSVNGNNQGGNGVRRGKRCLYKSMHYIDELMSRCVQLSVRIRQSILELRSSSLGRPFKASMMRVTIDELECCAKSFSCLLMLTLLSGTIEAGPAGEVPIIPKCKARLCQSSELETKPVVSARLHLAGVIGSLQNRCERGKGLAMNLLFLVLLFQSAPRSDRDGRIALSDRDCTSDPVESVRCVSTLNSLIRISAKEDIVVRLLAIQLVSYLVSTTHARQMEPGAFNLMAPMTLSLVSESVTLITSACFSSDLMVSFNAMLAMSRILKSDCRDLIEATPFSLWLAPVMQNAVQQMTALGDSHKPDHPHIMILAKVALNNFASVLIEWQDGKDDNEFDAFMGGCEEATTRLLRENAVSCRSEASEALLRRLGARGSEAESGLGGVHFTQSSSAQADHVFLFGLFDVYRSLW